MSIMSFSRAFVLSAPVVAVMPLRGGHIHDSWTLRLADESRWVLQRVNEQVFADLPALAHNVERVVAHLRGQGEPLWLVPTQGGAQHLAAAGTLWRMWPYLPGRSLAQAHDPVQAEAAGRAFGRFARQVADMPADDWQPSLPRFHDLDWRLVQLEAAKGQAGKARLELARAALAEVHAQAASRHDLRPWLPRLPHRLAHCDAKLANVRLHAQRDEAVSVLDFDTVMRGTPLYDLGDLIRSLSSPEPEDSPHLDRVQVRGAYVRALLRGYLDQTSLTEAERAAIPAAGAHLMLIMALRFLTDYLAGDPYFGTAYPQHNLDRCHNQLALLKHWRAAGAGLMLG